MKRLFPVLLLAVASTACSHEDAGGPSVPKGPEARSSAATAFTVNVAGLRLREQEGPDAPVIRSLQQGEQLYDLQQVSDYTTQITLRGITFDEPWLKVRTEQGEIGWVYGGALHADLGGGDDTYQMLLHKRLTTLFGPALRDSIAQYRQSFSDAATDRALAEVYARGLRIRDALEEPLRQQIAVPDPAQLPDLFWLEQVMPAFQPTLVAEGTAYALFADFREWSDKAGRTEGRSDDAFFRVAIQHFPEDSVAYFYPVYFLQTWDYGGHSLLGRGHHLHLLTELEQLQRTGKGYFATAIRSFTQNLVNDMTSANVTYWESAEAIVLELTQILDRQWTVLTQADRIALQTRLKQFRNPQRYGLETGYALGKYETN